MAKIKITTSQMEVYKKFNDLKIVNKISFADNAANRKYLAKIIKNINRYNNYIEATIADDRITINKKRSFDFNIYHRY